MRGRWQEIEQLYHAVLELPRLERLSFIDRVCGSDQELRRELLSLIRQAEHDAEFLSQPALPEGFNLIALNRPKYGGQRIGQYRAVKLIGQGGMGEVYLAEDLRLGRPVALKLLPDFLVDDAESVRRFRREALAASAISHPHVAHIYEAGVDAGRHYLAMEYVEGVTLRELLDQGRPSTRAAVDLALQVAEALAAAHQIGVYHRDIKPENIMVRRDGYAKVLDFGLAKLSDVKAGHRPFASPEQSAHETHPGLVIGTAAYMSPEQVRGQQVNGQSDLWSLGVVLYEMLAGRRPFEGETPSDVSVAVLAKQPPPPATGALKAELNSVVFKALEKDVSSRYQKAEEFISDLRRLRRRLELSEATDESDPRGAPPASTKEAQPSRLFGLRGKVLLGLALLGIVFGFLYFRRGARQGGIIEKAAGWEATRLAGGGRAVRAAISPDGKWVAYVTEEASRQGLHLRRSDQAEGVVPLVPAGDLEFMGVAFSPDSQHVYYSVKRSEDVIATLYRVAVGGAPERLLTDVDSAPSFSPDGRQMVFLRQGADGSHESLYLANTDGSNVRAFYTRRMPEFIPIHAQPAWSPDGRVILCAVGAYENSVKKTWLAAVRVVDGVAVPITHQDWADIAQTAWTADGKAVVMAARDQPAQDFRRLWLVSYPDGQAAPMTGELNDYYGVSVSNDQRHLISLAGSRTAKLYVVELDGSQQARQITPGSDDGFGAVWLADGRIVFGSNAGGNPDIWVMDSDGGNRRQLTFSEYADTDPAVSPDGHAIVFTSAREGGRHIWRMDADGQNQRQLTTGPGESTPVIARDGETVFFFGFGAGVGTLGKVSINGGEATTVVTGMPRFPALSPDGQWLAFAYRPPGATANKIGLVPFTEPSSTPRVFEPAAGARSPGPVRWLRNSSGFAYIVTREGVSNIWAQPLGGGPARQLTRFTDQQIYSFDFSPDGRRVVCARGETLSQVLLFRHK
jgi:eukaryotic-like serine/threonine-protein kinase